MHEDEGKELRLAEELTVFAIGANDESDYAISVVAASGTALGFGSACGRLGNLVVPAVASTLPLATPSPHGQQREGGGDGTRGRGGSGRRQRSWRSPRVASFSSPYCRYPLLPNSSQTQ